LDRRPRSDSMTLEVQDGETHSLGLGQATSVSIPTSTTTTTATAAASTPTTSFLRERGGSTNSTDSGSGASSDERFDGGGGGLAEPVMRRLASPLLPRVMLTPLSAAPGTSIRRCRVSSTALHSSFSSHAHLLRIHC
jgi:hypothetical protein